MQPNARLRVVHIVIRHETLDYAPVSARRKRFAVVDICAAAGVVIAFVWFEVLSYCDHSGAHYSNRDFAPPAFLLSLAFSLWLAFRLTAVPLVVRIVTFPFILLAGYAGFGLAMILMN